MPTLRQKALAKKIIEAVEMTPPPTEKALLVSAGYPQSTVLHTPGRQFDQKGVKDALAEFGFSEDIAKKVVGDILTSPKSSDKNKLSAADMTFKVHGTYAAEKRVQMNFNAIPMEGMDEVEVMLAATELGKKIMQSYDIQKETQSLEQGESRTIQFPTSSQEESFGGDEGVDTSKA